MTDRKPDLVLTFAHGYAWKDLSVFFNSLRASGFNGDIVVFASRLGSETILAMRDQGVLVHKVTLPLFKLRNVLLLPGWLPWKLLLRLVPTKKWRRGIGKHVFNIMCARFAHFHHYLERHADRYGRVLVTDVRDVCFQTDPFAALGARTIVSFLEPLKIDGGANGQWMVEAFGRNLDKTLLNEWVCCAGVTLGKSTAMLDYLGKMLDHLCEVERMTPVAGVDQAVHNFLFHRSQLPGGETMPNGNPLCMTMGHGDPFELDEQSLLISQGKVVSILHQYDRHPGLKSAKQERFAKS